MFSLVRVAVTVVSLQGNRNPKEYREGRGLRLDR